MATQRVCERCARPVSTFAPDGLCANCLFDNGADSPADAMTVPVDPHQAAAPELGTGPPHQPGLPLAIRWGAPGSSAAATDRQSTNPGGRRFLDYELLEEIARGGMGVVYKARQVSLNRTVAVKMILSGQLAGIAEILRFRQEAEAAAGLQHPNIVAIHEVGEHEGQHYFSMDFVEGQSLAELARETPLPLLRAAGYVQTIAAALHFAHQRGIIHRDLKPSNVLIDTNDQPRVTDFGLAKRLPPKSEIRNPKSEIDLTLSGQILGTPNYMPPEQARGESDTLGPAADVYSLGGILFFLLTGRPPFLAESVVETLQQVLTREPVSPRVLNPKVPRDLETICLKSLAKEPAQRYGSAQDLAEDLGRWMRHEPIRARPVSIWEKSRKWIRRRPVAAGLAAALVTCTVLAVLVVAERHRTRHQRLQKEQAELRARLQNIERQFATDTHQALRTLAGIVRAFPRERLGPERLVNALRQRAFLLPCVNDAPAHLVATRTPPRDDTLSLDGRRRAHFRNSTTITVRDARTDAPLLTISNAHRLVIRSVTWSADGQFLVSASADNTAKIWSATNGVRLQSVAHGQDQAVYHAVVSPDGKRLLTASRDRTARLWDASSGSLMAEPMAHRNAVRKARFHPDGTILVTASDDYTVRLWHGESGAPVAEPLHLGKAVDDAFFTPDGLHVRVLVGTNELRTFRIAWGAGTPPLQLGTPAASARPLSSALATRIQELSRIVPARITFTNASPDGALVAVALDDKSARILDARAPVSTMVTLMHDAAVNCVRFSPDGLRVATSTVTPNPRARVWDARTGLPLTDWLPSNEPIASVEFSTDGRWLVPSEGMPWPLHLDSGRSPKWLPDLADAIAAVSLDSHSDDAGVIDAFRRLQHDINSDPANDPLTEWAREFVADETSNEAPAR